MMISCLQTPMYGRVLGAALVLPLLALAACAPAQTMTADTMTPAQAPTNPQATEFGLVIHGGAGTITRDAMTPEREAEYRAALTEALQAGYRILQAGGSSLDAVVAAVNLMEDSPLFNAGHGAVFTNDGRNELDAAIMDGRTLNAGAVAGVTRTRNPIDLARKVMEESPHVMLVGAGAEEFGQQQGVAMVEPSYFFTQHRWEALQRAQEQERIELSEDDPAPRSSLDPDDRKMGTVGAVALDRNGNLAAATSTGGMTNKRWGRVGDVPVIGAGTYANNTSCAVSATGHGEYFIRSVVAYDICALVEYRGMSVQEAANHVVMEKLVERGGSGGVIAIDRNGNMTMPFNTPGMYRGQVDAQGRVTVGIYRDE